MRIFKKIFAPFKIVKKIVVTFTFRGRHRNVQ